MPANRGQRQRGAGWLADRDALSSWTLSPSP